MVKLVILLEPVLEREMQSSRMCYATIVESQDTLQESAGKAKVGEANLTELHVIIIMGSAWTVCAVGLGVTGPRTAGQIYPNSVDAVERKVTLKTSAD